MGLTLPVIKLFILEHFLFPSSNAGTGNGDETLQWCDWEGVHHLVEMKENDVLRQTQGSAGLIFITLVG